VSKLLQAAEAIDWMVGRIAAAAGWLFLVCSLVICFDVVTRKFGYQIPGFGSTRLQELEWHLHTAIFAFWLGFAYLRNAHVRIDLIASRAGPRGNAWLELFGCLFFALPYCIVAIGVSADYAWIAWLYGEGSTSPSGLPHRFVPKGMIALGLILLFVALVSAFLRTLVFLFGPKDLRARSAFAGAKQGPSSP